MNHTYDYSNLSSGDQTAKPVSQEDEDAARSLLRDFREQRFEFCSHSLFWALARWFAARARSIKARIGYQRERNAPEILVLRALRRVVEERRTDGEFVYGLAQEHRGDWKAIERRAGEAVRALQTAPRVSAPRTSSAPKALPQPRQPAAPAVVHGPPVLVFGGLPHEVKLARVRAATGVSVEWLDTNCWESAYQRVRGNRVLGLVIIEGFVRHRASQPVLDAARAAGVPVAYAKRGGIHSLVVAVRTVLERV